jgi:hypothetical protein
MLLGRHTRVDPAGCRRLHTAVPLDVQRFQIPTVLVNGLPDPMQLLRKFAYSRSWPFRNPFRLPLGAPTVATSACTNPHKTLPLIVTFVHLPACHRDHRILPLTLCPIERSPQFGRVGHKSRSAIVAIVCDSFPLSLYTYT